MHLVGLHGRGLDHGVNVFGECKSVPQSCPLAVVRAVFFIVLSAADICM